MDQCGHIHTLLHWTPHPKLGLHLLEANLSTKTEDALNMHTSASLQETDEGDINRGQLSADVVSLWHAAKSIGFMTTQVILFVGWGSLWESQEVDVPRLLGKDLGMMLPTFLMGLLGIELRKRDNYSPQHLCFNSPDLSSINQKMLSASHLFVLSVQKLPAGFHLISRDLSSQSQGQGLHHLGVGPSYRREQAGLPSFKTAA